MNINRNQGVLELADDIPLTLADDPDINLMDLMTVRHVERRHLGTFDGMPVVLLEVAP